MPTVAQRYANRRARGERVAAAAEPERRAPVVRTEPGGAVVWLPGIRLDERFKCTERSTRLVKLTNRPVTGA